MSNALTMTGRSLRLSARSPEALLTALLLPVMLILDVLLLPTWIARTYYLM